jgi:iron complex outermembrane receptor protein
MTRSQQKRTGRVGRGAYDAATRHALRHVPLASAISAILAGVPVAQAQQAQATGGLEEVVVTAQKVSENLQNVPISIQVLGNQKLEELHVVSLDDYVKYMPSVSYSRGQGQGGNAQPGESHVYMRGVVSGANENHSGSTPSVGTYLDEQPVTTIDGTVDVHIYDIERIEVLEGPQGTLYGASSQAGTIRIITNKPDPKGFAAGYNLGLSSVDHGGTGYEAEGFVNLPMSPVAAIRLVAWDEKDPGFISNVAGTNAGACIFDGIRTFPTWAGQGHSTTSCPTIAPIGAGSISNAAFVKKDYNTADTKGGRAALKLFLGDNWTVTPTFMGQSVGTEGFFGYDPVVGDLQVAHFGPEYTQDSWTQSALTVEGKFSDFDVVYASAFMKRTTHGVADYSDYSEFYDRVYGSGAYWRGNNGLPIMPQEIVASHGYFQKWSHELRISTPQNLPVRATAGVFIERQLHDIFESYQMTGYNGNGFATSLSIPTQAVPSIWLTDETRVDRDKAAFAQATWDISSQWALNAGVRHFISDNTLQGFYGYSYNYHLLTGYSTTPGSNPPYYTCQTHPGSALTPPDVVGAPCTDISPSGAPERVTASGNVPRYNVTFKIDPDAMVYATYSEGFRPGGVERTALAAVGPSYQPDFLKNYEIGWKTQWFGRTVRWNGAIFREDWDHFQFSFLGPNSVTIITNAPAARIKGIESELEWLVSDGLTLSNGVTFLDPRLTANYCGTKIPSTSCPTFSTSSAFGPTVNGPQAPAGTNLPISPKFKGNLIARYKFNNMGGWQPNVQAAWVYQTKTAPALRIEDVQSIGMQPAYGLFDLSGGLDQHGTTIQLLITNVFDRRAELSRFEQCTVTICNQPYIVPAQPRTIGLKFGQKF